MINFIIPEDNNEEEELGIFHFRFWVNGYYFEVVVDDRLPYKNKKDPATARFEGNEYWPSLIEKAYAKMHGTYGAISGGHTNDALEDFTGGVVEAFKYSKEIPPFEIFTPKNNIEVFCGVGTNPVRSGHRSDL